MIHFNYFGSPILNQNHIKINSYQVHKLLCMFTLSLWVVLLTHGHRCWNCTCVKWCYMWHVLGFGHVSLFAQINNSNPNVCGLSPFAEIKSLLLMKLDCVCVVNINPNIPTLVQCQNHSKSIISDHHQAWCRFSSFCNKSFCTASAREASYSTWRSRSSPRYLLGELRGGKRVRHGWVLDLGMVGYGWLWLDIFWYFLVLIRLYHAQFMLYLDCFPTWPQWCRLCSKRGWVPPTCRFPERKWLLDFFGRFLEPRACWENWSVIKSSKILNWEILKTKKCLLYIQLATSVCTACTAARRCAMCGSRTIPVVAPATAPGRSPALRCQRPDATRPWFQGPHGCCFP